MPYVLRPLGVLAHYGMTRHHPMLKRASFALIERRLISQQTRFISQAWQNSAKLRRSG